MWQGSLCFALLNLIGRIPASVLGLSELAISHIPSQPGADIPCVPLQMSASEFGDVLPPLTSEGPANVTGELDLTQSLVGTKVDDSYLTRGYKPSPIGAPNSANLSHVVVAAPGRISPGAAQYGSDGRAEL